MIQALDNPNDRQLRRIVMIAIALLLVYLLWDVLVTLVIVVAGVLIAARFGGPILRFFSTCCENLKKNL